MMTKIGTILTVLALATTGAFAADLGYRGWEVRAGALFPDGGDSGFSLGAGIDFGEAWEDWHLYGMFGYASAEGSETFVVLGDAFEIDGDLDAISFGAELRWQPPESPLYLGGGLSVNSIDTEVDFLGVNAGNDETQIYLQLVAGYEFTPNWAAELRYQEGDLFETFPLFDWWGVGVVWRP